LSSSTNSNAIYTAPAVSGTNTVEISVDDGHGGIVTTNMELVVIKSWEFVGGTNVMVDGVPILHDSGAAISATSSPIGDIYFAICEKPANQISAFKLVDNQYSRVGSPFFSEGGTGPSEGSLTFYSGIPRVVYADGGRNGWPVVREYNELVSNNWLRLSGLTEITQIYSSWTSLLYTSTGVPYVGFYDYNTTGANVFRFTGLEWTNCGPTNLSGGQIGGGLSMAMAPNDTVFLTFRDYLHEQYGTVMYYTNEIWTNLGPRGFTTAGVRSIQLRFDNNVPYVCFMHGLNASERITVMRYNGTAWELVGIARFTPITVYKFSFAIDNGILYLAYIGGGLPESITVMKFNGSSWVLLGKQKFSPSSAHRVKLLIQDGIPHVLFNYLPTNHIGIMSYR